MGKGKRLKSKRKNKPLSEKEIYNIFSGDGLEELTDELYNELLSKDYKEEDLKFFKDQGFQYCRSRNSFFEPPHFMDDE
jgi:hypothetical protein